VLGFQISAGSIIGRDHMDIPQNNQDAYRYLVTDNLIIAIICDGCGDRKDTVASELGASLGANLLAHTIISHAKKMGFNYSDLRREDCEHPGFWERVRQDVLAKIRVIALDIGESFSEVIQSYFLFTTIGVLITPRWSIFFSIGDGLIVINGEFRQIGPFAENKPPYIAYALSDTGSQNQAFRFTLQSVLPTDKIENFLLGSDGSVELSTLATHKMPDGSEIGPLSQFWENEGYFKNPDMIRRRLKLINSDVVKITSGVVTKRRPLLSDDTTIVVGKRILNDFGSNW